MKKDLRVKVLTLVAVIGMGSAFAIVNQYAPETAVLAEESQELSEEEAEEEAEEENEEQSSLIEIEGEEFVDGSEDGEEVELVQFEDVIDYSTLDTTKEYILRATLYMAKPATEEDDPEEGREWTPVVDQDGAPIVEYLGFIAPSESGQINYTMTLDATLLEAQGDMSFRIIYKMFEAKDMGNEFEQGNSDFV